MILLVSHRGDDHLAPVRAALRRLGREAAVLDTGALPARGRLAVALGPRGVARIRTPGALVDLRRVTAVWWRRPRALAADPVLRPPDAAFAIRQTDEALRGLAACADARWVNEPWLESAAAHKIRQLAAAEDAGLAIPRTLVTNDPAAARAFLGPPGRRDVIHKALHATPEDWRTTRLLGPKDRRRLRSVRLAPVILQDHVPGVDVRVTAVGGELFAVAIDARRTASPTDFRPAFDEARVWRHALPQDVARRLRRLLRALGLVYAAIDLRLRDGGEHVFLEANPSGQWLFVERRTLLPITEAVAALLAKPR